MVVSTQNNLCKRIPNKILKTKHNLKKDYTITTMVMGAN